MKTPNSARRQSVVNGCCKFGRSAIQDFGPGSPLGVPSPPGLRVRRILIKLNHGDLILRFHCPRYALPFPLQTHRINPDESKTVSVYSAVPAPRTAPQRQSYDLPHNIPMPPKKAPPPIYRLRITLVGIDPPIWRVVEVPSSMKLRCLHAAFQMVMGWTDSKAWV